jgi:hypothetical protein
VTVLAFEKHLPWLLPLGGVGRVDTVRPHSSRVCVGCKYKLCAHDLMSAPQTARLAGQILISQPQHTGSSEVIKWAATKNRSLQTS